jgi:DNA-binding response OmpR family regulator
MKTLIVDDDRTLADVLAFTMRREGYEILLAYDGKMAIQRWMEEDPDLIILDVNLPVLDGFEVCAQIRKTSSTPILLLTVRDDEDDIVRGLKLGADDYITKPFSPRQLVARVQAILRRSGRSPSTTFRESGPLKFDINRREVVIAEERSVQLTALESRLLDLLMRNPGQVMTIEMIIDSVWGPRSGDRDMVRQLIHRLRVKLEPDPEFPVYIQNIPRLGYSLVAEEKNEED